MTNADKFKSLFGLYATELWAMPEKNFLKWLNSEVSNCSEFPNNSDTISRQWAIELAMQYCPDDDGTCSKADKDIRDLLDELENLPSAQPKRTEERTETHACDLISRQMLLEYIHGEPVGKMLCGRYNLDGLIERFPSAQPNTCRGCKHEPRYPHDEPCATCSNNYVNKWSSKNA